jgi:pyruvate formate lyase activating enzyme
VQSDQPGDVRGTIFDIKRCALHDGPGIRTTVFLKGCPLACLWCHNPESIGGGPEVKYVPARCRSCGACVDVCGAACHAMDQGCHTFSRAACGRCGRCAQACPAGAMQLVGTTVRADEVMAQVARDAHYYAASGGGLTLSGGEPLMQPHFAKALLELARRQNIHTCLDTSGHAPAGALLEVLDLVDLFLYDLKETDELLHRRFTGVDNRLVLENLRQISAGGGRAVLRCPIVPGLNDRPEHLRQVAALSRELPGIVEINVLPFHPLAREKSAHVGRAYELANVPEPDARTVQQWIEQLQSLTAVPVKRG